MRILGRITFAAIGAALIGTAMAQDVPDIELHNLTENHPTLLEDAYPVPEGVRAFQLSLAYLSFEEDDIFAIEPGFLWGLTRDWQASVSLPFFFGDDSDVGDLRLGVMWGNEGINTPDIALGAGFELDVPTNSDDDEDDDEVDTRFKLFVTYPLDDNQGITNSRLHLNAVFINSEGDSEGAQFAFGYSQLLDPETVFVADLVRFDPEIGDASDLLEFGLRRRMATGYGSVALKLGMSDNALDWGLAFGWQTRL